MEQRLQERCTGSSTAAMLPLKQGSKSQLERSPATLHCLQVDTRQPSAVADPQSVQAEYTPRCCCCCCGGGGSRGPGAIEGEERVAGVVLAAVALQCRPRREATAAVVAVVVACPQVARSPAVGEGRREMKTDNIGG
jgi:hypothetical protein